MPLQHIKYLALVLTQTLALTLLPFSAMALEFKSVVTAKAILYNAPRASANKVLLLSQGYPVEVIVDLGEWVKVRDAHGSINWIEAKALSSKRMVMVALDKAEIRQSAEAGANLIATLEKDVVLEVTESTLNNGWLKVKHRDGIMGYILLSSVWGFN